MSYLLTSDLHLVDSDQEEYRWGIFDILKSTAAKERSSDIFILGDMWDRKDRHTGRLVNRIVDSLLDLCGAGLYINILSGNHDAPLTGVYYWEFLNRFPYIRYITKPRLFQDIWLLPFSPNPIKEWKSLDFKKVNAIFMHQPVQGAFVDAYRKLDQAPILPDFPSHISCFSGDIHNPQSLGSITYLGVPHPVHFNETWKNRIILINDCEYKNYKEILIDSTRRAILDITSSEELQKLDYKEGDQVRIRYMLKGENLSSWNQEQESIRKWAEERGIYLASIEAKLIGDGVKAETKERAEIIELMRPEEVIRMFGATEKLSEDVIKAGLELIK